VKLVHAGRLMANYQSAVKEYRQRAGLSQEALARELGVSRQTVVNIERGLNEPRVMLALAIAAILGVAIDQLFRRESPDAHVQLPR
jgi:putative transcriptional regulator